MDKKKYMYINLSSDQKLGYLLYIGLYYPVI